MENQHRLIPTYRDLSPDEIDTIAAIKHNEDAVVQFFDQIKTQNPNADKRDLAMAKTHLQDGFSKLVRAVARPDTPWNRV